jgi:hypothetical protein
MLGAKIRTELYSNLRNWPLECAGTGENLFEQSSLFVGSILNTSRHLWISWSWIVERLSKLIRGNKGIKQKKPVSSNTPPFSFVLFPKLSPSSNRKRVFFLFIQIWQLQIFCEAFTSGTLTNKILNMQNSLIIQHARKFGSVAEMARLRRSLQGRVAVVTASTDGYVTLFVTWIF